MSIDHSVLQFDADYLEFRSQFDNLQAQIHSFVDSWFERQLTVSKSGHRREHSQSDNGNCLCVFVEDAAPYCEER